MNGRRQILGGLVIALSLSHPAYSDLVSPYGGETAPNFAEIKVMEGRVRLALEIDLSDYPAFVADGSGKSLADRTGRTVAVAVDGVTIEPITRLVDVRKRKPRVSAARQTVQPRPRSEEVVYAELEFPFEGHPETVSFAPPLENDGMPAASIGVLVEHAGVPVTDYRYLSQPETLILDWEDPWFSAFGNRNLTRHHKSPLMSFLLVEPREVRHEIIVRLRDLESWMDFGLGATEMIGAEQMQEIKERAAEFFASRNPLVIDGESAIPENVRVSEIAVGAEGIRILEDVLESPRATSLLGIVLSYPRSKLANEVGMTWELFPEGADAIPVTLTDPAGSVPAQITRGDPSINWTNYLKTWEEPAVRPVFVAASAINVPALSMLLLLAGIWAGWMALRRLGPRRVAFGWVTGAVLAAAIVLWPLSLELRLPGSGLSDRADATSVIAGLLENVSSAMLETQSAGFETALTPFVQAEKSAEVGAEIRRGLSVTLPTGARALTEAVLDLEVEEVTSNTDIEGNQILASWTADVSGGHWGHAHRRLVKYRGLFDVSRSHDTWYLDGLTILSAQTGT